VERRILSPPARNDRRSPTPAAVHKREAIRRLKAALAEDRFVLHYQPIVDARDGRVAGVEALLRWRTPDREPDAVRELLEAAERSPVIFKLENWTLGQALRAARTWRDAGLTGLRVGVNLSAREFPRADLVQRIRSQLSAARLPPSALALEITESSRLRDFGAAADRLERLAGMGVELWLDDFGTGHSSLEWLSHLPTHGLKIPGTFVERLFADERCQVIVTRLIELAHDLGLRVVAEEVETAEQRAWLTACGCDLFQGFLLDAPMPAEELPRALAGAASPPPGRSQP
jgi:EAL domain-containing protein (putative c-di-GMP-specific phosphodiesterase class I)